MIKICTSIEQSKKLVELGLDSETADMSYNRLKVSEGGEPESAYHILIDGGTEDKSGLLEVIPCWSLGTLLELMPPFLVLENIPCLLYVKKYNQRYEIYYANNGYAPKGTIEGNALIDTAFNMVVWLLENEYIK